MKVVKTQVELVSWTIEKVCPTCKSTLATCADDIKYHWDANRDNMYYANCVLCDGRLYFSLKELPEVVQAVSKKLRSDPPTYVDD